MHRHFIISSFSLHKIIKVQHCHYIPFVDEKSKAQEIEVHPEVRVLRVKSELGTS